MSVLLNLGSLLLGLTALGLPVYFLLWPTGAQREKWSIYSIASFSACGLALCLQLFEIEHRTGLEDWSALLDTIHWIALAAIALLLVTILLNTVALLVAYGREHKRR